MKLLFRWNLTKDTGLAFLMGIVMIALSLCMLPFSGESVLDLGMSFLLRDVIMILGLGVIFVTLYCKKKGEGTWNLLGIKKEKWHISLVVDVVLAVLLLIMFLMEKVPEHILSLGNLYGTVYILAAGIFEMLFIYGYLRMEFQEAFGIIPAIIVTAAFYSFHHAGFQPEFIHLFGVGIMYATVLMFTRNMLIVFPFFWGVGALYDVLVASEAGNSLKNVESFVIGLFVILVTAGWLLFLKRRKLG